MGLFKNEVGRPSNETKKKRKIVIGCAIAILIVLFGGVGLFVIKTFKPLKGDISGSSKYATVTKCYMPYSVSKCGSEYNRTIYHVQTMLKELGYYSGKVNGYFDNATKTAVTKFQKAKKYSQTGEIGPNELSVMANLDGYAWITITYANNGGSGSLTGTVNGKQTLLGTNTPISPTKLTKSGKTHVGWTATISNKSGVQYYYGCNSTKCTSPQRYTASQYKSLGTKFKPYVYSIGEVRTAYDWSGHAVTFTAYYCDGNNATYNKSTSSCSGGTTNQPASNQPAKTTSYTTTNSQGFNVLKYDIKALSSIIGSQDVAECHYYSIAYGSYIILGKRPQKVRTTKPTVNSRYAYFDSSYFGGCYVDSIYDKNCKNDVPSSLTYANEYKMIIKKINSGIPVVIHAKNNSGGAYNGEHWVLVVGYNSKVSSISNDTNGLELLKNVWVIDPYGDYGYNDTNHTLWEGIAYDRSKSTSKSKTIVKMYNAKYRTWDSRDKAK